MEFEPDFYKVSEVVERNRHLTDPDVVSLENSDKCVSGKLTALVGVEYLWVP